MQAGLKPLGVERLWLLVLLIPTIIGLIFGTVGSVFATGLISFLHWDLITPATWAGLDNFALLFTDSQFHKSLFTTFTFSAFYVPGVLATSLTAAVLLNRKLRGVGFFRTVYFLPVISSAVAVGLVWSWLYAKDTGLLNRIIETFGGSPVNWLGSQMVLFSVVIVNIWGAVGEGAVIFLAGLQAVPRDVYDAADVDGANEWQQFSQITLPLLAPTIFFQAVLTTIHAFQAFEYVYILTRQAGGGSSMPVLMFTIYRNAFNWFRMGQASSQAVVLALIIFGLTLIYSWLQRRWVEV